MSLTKAQRHALKRIYDSGLGAEDNRSYRDFRQSAVVPRMPTSLTPYVMVEWKGIWFGVEPDGYTHS